MRSVFLWRHIQVSGKKRNLSILMILLWGTVIFWSSQNLTFFIQLRRPAPLLPFPRPGPALCIGRLLPTHMRESNPTPRRTPGEAWLWAISSQHFWHLTDDGLDPVLRRGGGARTASTAGWSFFPRSIPWCPLVIYFSRYMKCLRLLQPPRLIVSGAGECSLSPAGTWPLLSLFLTASEWKVQVTDSDLKPPLISLMKHCFDLWLTGFG